MAHKTASRFEFSMARNTAVIVCDRVRQGHPILYVAHDEGGDWQFLCGGQHDEGSGDGGSIGCLECVVADDPSLNDLADLCEDWSAERDQAGAAWRRHDHSEDFINETVKSHGWVVQLIREEGDLPAFAYTIGLHRTFGGPELIVVGLRTEVMHGMLNDCGERMRAGETLPVGTPFSGVLEDYDVLLRPVTSPESYREYVGYGLWFYGGPNFPLLQLVWPDKEGRFPGQEGANPFMKTQQPLLP